MAIVRINNAYPIFEWNAPYTTIYIYIQPTQNKVYYLKFGQNLDQIVLFSKKIEFNQNVRLPLNSIQTF